MTRLLLLSVAASLAACGPSSGSGASGSAAGGAALPDTAMVQSVSTTSTAALVAGDLRRVSPSVAIQTIDLWIVQLDTASASGAGDVRDDLETLRNLLQSSPLDGPAIGRTLRSAGERTAALADSADGLAGLARVLRLAGGRLVPDTTESGTVGARDGSVQ